MLKKVTSQFHMLGLVRIDLPDRVTVQTQYRCAWVMQQDGRVRRNDKLTASLVFKLIQDAEER